MEYTCDYMKIIYLCVYMCMCMFGLHTESRSTPWPTNHGMAGFTITFFLKPLDIFLSHNPFGCPTWHFPSAPVFLWTWDMGRDFPTKDIFICVSVNNLQVKCSSFQYRQMRSSQSINKLLSHIDSDPPQPSTKQTSTKLLLKLHGLYWLNFHWL